MLLNTLSQTTLLLIFSATAVSAQPALQDLHDPAFWIESDRFIKSRLKVE
jgi:hypothetical protein